MKLHDLILERLKERLEPFGVTVKFVAEPWKERAGFLFEKIIPAKRGLVDADARILGKDMWVSNLDIFHRRGTPEQVAKGFARSTAADVIFDMMDLLSESKEVPNVPQNA